MGYPPANRGTVVLWGLLANSPFGGMTWQVLHHLVGLRRLGFDVWYVEDSDTPMLRPGDLEIAEDPEQNAAFTAAILARIGFEDRWILRVPYSEETLGQPRARLDRLYREADAVFNLCGAHWLLDRHDAIEMLVLLETDPVSLQVHLASGDPVLAEQVGRYAHLFSYGQNLGRRCCPVPTGGVHWQPTRPPVVLDWWAGGPPPRDASVTTVATWGDHGAGKDVSWDGASYRWRKDVAFAPYLDLPARAPLPLELALARLGPDDEHRLQERGWRLRSASTLREPDAYRGYVRSSLAEFTPVKEQYTRTRCGWMSDRSVCYLAAGRPVVCESTGAEDHVPVGAGLLTFTDADADGAVAALEQVAADPEYHGNAARDLAREHFAAERVLGAVAERVGLL
ncbi:MAG TPA: hypothetical protein VG365_08095 [Solirubrobacteraceae bacterium]|nr:hypothetical protein [Solirubrobacteraceae bacterium]